MSEKINHHRRHFLGAAAMALFAAELVTIGSAAAQSSKTWAAVATTIKPKSNTSFGLLKQINAGVLNVGYAEAGPADGPPVILLHGWPYDIHTYVDVAPLLASVGYRVIVPYLRGYGTTRFLSSETVRNGQQSVIAVDIIALMDALKIEKAIIAGCDWGARTANIIAALWPERCKAMVSVSGYLIGSRETNKMPLPPKAELQWWYQYYFATERGRAGYEEHRYDFAKLIWQIASPQWKFDDATFNRSAASFDNPDHVSIVIHNYRWRLSLAEGEPEYDNLENRLAEMPVITVPTITPFSYRWDPTDAMGDDVRFKNYGLAPKSAADFAFLLHGFHFLKDEGVMAIILPHGVLFRGGAEERIRTKLLKDGHIDTVIGLPANLFYSTGIPVCILVLKKCKKPDDVLFINAAEHFLKGKRQNQLTGEHIAKIIDTYQFRKEEDRYSKRFGMERIAEEGYNLNISRYIRTATADEEIDLRAVNAKLVGVEEKIKDAKDRHNAFLKELGLPLLP